MEKIMENITAGEAPDGYKAVPSEFCTGCAFLNGGYCDADPEIPKCAPGSIGVSVIFVPLKSGVPATASHPMGSMGEEVA